MNEVETYLKNMTLSDYERSVPRYARLTVGECAKICDYLGIDFVHHPYSETESLPEALGDMYQKRGIRNLAWDLRHSNGAAVNPAKGEPAGIWVRSAFGKHVLTCVFFHNLGGALTTSIDWNQDDIVQAHHDLNHNIRELLQALCYGMGMAACCLLVRAGKVRKNVESELRTQFHREVDKKSGYFSIVKTHIDQINTKDKPMLVLTREEFEQIMGTTKKTLLQDFGPGEDQDSVLTMDQYLRQANQDTDPEDEVFFLDQDDPDFLGEDEIKNLIVSVMEKLSNIYDYLAETSDPPRILADTFTQEQAQDIATNIQRLGRAMALQDLLSFEMFELGWSVDKVWWASDVLNELTLTMTYAYNICGQENYLQESTIPFLAVFGVGTVSEDMETHDGYFETDGNDILPRGVVKDPHFYGPFANRKCSVIWDSRFYDLWDLANANVDLMANLQQSILLDNMLPEQEEQHNFQHIPQNNIELNKIHFPSGHSCHNEEVGPGRLIALQGVLYGPWKVMLDCWNQSQHAYGLRCLEKPFDVRLLDGPGQGGTIETLNKKMTKILNRDGFEPEESKCHLFGIIPYASTSNRLLLLALAGASENLPYLTHLGRHAQVEGKKVVVDLNESLNCIDTHNQNLVSQSFTFRIGGKTTNDFGQRLPRLNIPNILLRPEVVRRTESTFRAVLEGCGITVKGKMKARSK